MTRHNFSKAVKKAAYERSGGVCEAIGPRWGHAPGVRCTADLSKVAVEYDHWPLGAHAEGSNTLENCNATCKACNQYAANHFDKAVEAKIKRVRRAHGLDPDKRKPRRAIPSRGFNKSITKGFDGKVRASKRAVRPSQP